MRLKRLLRLALEATFRAPRIFHLHRLSPAIFCPALPSFRRPTNIRPRKDVALWADDKRSDLRNESNANQEKATMHNTYSQPLKGLGVRSAYGSLRYSFRCMIMTVSATTPR